MHSLTKKVDNGGNRKFSKEDTEMAKYAEKMLNIIIIRKMQINPLMR